MVSESFISLHLHNHDHHHHHNDNHHHHYDHDQKRRPMESRSSPHPLEARAARRLAKEQRECLRQEQRGFSSLSSLFGIMMIITIISFESTMSWSIKSVRHFKCLIFKRQKTPRAPEPTLFSCFITGRLECYLVFFHACLILVNAQSELIVINHILAQVSVCVGSSDQWLCVARLPPSLTEEAFLNLASNYGKVCECQPLSTIIVILIVNHSHKLQCL